MVYPARAAASALLEQFQPYSVPRAAIRAQAKPRARHARRALGLRALGLGRALRAGRARGLQ